MHVTPLQMVLLSCVGLAAVELFCSSTCCRHCLNTVG